MSSTTGPFAGYAPNREAMLRVVQKHQQHAHRIIHVRDGKVERDEPVRELV